MPKDNPDEGEATVIVGMAEAAMHMYSSAIAALPEERAAAAPAATLGQQLYVARRRAKLSAKEAANGAGLRADLLNDLEAGEIPTEDETVKVKGLIEALSGGSPVISAIEHERSQIGAFEESIV